MKIVTPGRDAAALAKPFDQAYKERTEDDRTLARLKEFRSIIDKLDNNIISLLKDRSALIEDIGKLKMDDQMTIFQLERWFDIMKNREAFAKENGVNTDLIHELFAVIHKYSVSQQIDQLKKD